MQHPDEGTIHAWLDGQLPRDEAAAIEAHVAECRPCADAVAEARGLIAASSRILMALDGVPRDVSPKQTAPAAHPAPNAVVDLAARSAVAPVRRAPRRWLSGPSLAAAAAVVIAVGSFAVLQNRGGAGLAVADREIGPLSAGPFADSSAGPVPTVAAPSAPPAPTTVPPTLGRAATAASEAARPAEEAQDARKASRFAPSAASTVAGASAAMRDELQTEKKETDAVQAKARATVADAPRLPLATVAPVSSDSILAKKVDTNTVTIIRGQVASVESTRQAPAPPPAPQAGAQVRIRGSSSIATSSATTGSVQGRVTDGIGTGISTAMVTIAGTSIGSTTDSSGHFALHGVSPGPVQLVVRRIGYEQSQQAVSVAAGQQVSADVMMKPAAVSLSEVVVTGSAAASDRRAFGSSAARVPARSDSEPGAAMTATGSRAIGCYELGVTPSSGQARSSLRQVPRRVALDAEIVPANADGIWYRARDLARTGAIADGLWRPVGTDGVEIEWLYGSKLARIRLTGPAQAMMRGTVDEIDRSAGGHESGAVVSSRRACQ